MLTTSNDLKSYFSSLDWFDIISVTLKIKNYVTVKFIIFIHLYLILANFLFEFNIHITENWSNKNMALCYLNINKPVEKCFQLLKSIFVHFYYFFNVFKNFSGFSVWIEKIQEITIVFILTIKK